MTDSRNRGFVKGLWDVISNKKTGGGVMNTTYYSDLDYYVFIGSRGKILGYGMHPTMYHKYMIRTCLRS
jgi:hypothetical protein